MPSGHRKALGVKLTIVRSHTALHVWFTVAGFLVSKPDTVTPSSHRTPVTLLPPQPRHLSAISSPAASQAECQHLLSPESSSLPLNHGSQLVLAPCQLVYICLKLRGPEGMPEALGITPELCPDGRSCRKCQGGLQGRERGTGKSLSPCRG